MSIWKNFLTLEWVSAEKRKIKEQSLFLRTTNGEQSRLGVWGCLEANIVSLIGLTGCVPQGVGPRSTQGWREMLEDLLRQQPQWSSVPVIAQCPSIMTDLAKHQGVMHNCVPGLRVPGSVSGSFLVPETAAKGVS